MLGLLRESALLQAGAALAAGLLVAAGVVGLRRPAERWPRLLWGLAAVGALVVYGAAYVTATTGRLDETITWLSWYFSWPVLGLAALGLAGLGLAPRAAAAPGLVFAGLLLGVVGLQYLYDPLETGLQIGSMRRYVPVVLPLTMLFAALTAVGLLARVPAARYRAGLTLAAGALLVGLVARPSLAVVGLPLWDEALAQTAQVARLFPERAVVLMSPDLAGTHIPTSLAYLHDVDTILVQARNPDGEVLRRVIGGWRARGRAVFVVVGQQEFSFFAPDFALAAVERAHIDLYTLERTRTRAPQAVVSTPIRLQLFQVTRTIGPARTAIDVGTPADDLLYTCRASMGPSAPGIRPAARSGGPGRRRPSRCQEGRPSRSSSRAPARPPPPGRDLGVDRGAAGQRAGARRDPTDDPVGPAGDRRPGPDRPHDSVDGVQPAVPRPVVTAWVGPGTTAAFVAGCNAGCNGLVIARALAPDSDPSPVVRREPRTRAAGAPAATSQGQPPHPNCRPSGARRRLYGRNPAPPTSRRRACRDRGRCRCAGWRLNPRGAWAYTRHYRRARRAQSSTASPRRMTAARFTPCKSRR